MAQNLSSITETGHFTFHLKDQWQMFLEYEPSTQQLLTPSSGVATDTPEDAGKVRQETWNNEQIGDFVRKLGFLDKDKEEGGGHITLFLHFNQAS